MATTPPGAPTNLGLPANLAGLLCYAPCCIGLVFSIVVVIVEKQSRFVRFHGFQSLLFHAAVFAVGVVVNVGLTAVGYLSGALALLGSLLWLVVGLGILAMDIFLMVKAYGGEEFEIPTLGPMARGWV